jgi:class 3 adenylate cyclase
LSAPHTSALILRDVARCTNCGQTNPEGSQFCNSCGARLGAIPPSTGEARKVVTVVFADVVGSTSLVERLEPESARRVLDRYFEVMHAIVERHGGTVEKYIGDAVMAVFGIPTLHEDDALRAVRAAGGMRDALSVLNDELGGSFGVTIDIRIGVATGEVVARDPALGQAFVTGDAVNVAARLETTAEPGEILVDQPTYHRVRAVVGAQPLGRVAVKGKADPIPVHRLLVVDASSARRLDSVFVGRVTELALLSETLADVVGERATRLVTVIGEAGVGKSRLVEEFLRERPEVVAVIRGRCLPYGEGITYWPLKEAIAEAAGLDAGDSAAVARERIRGLVASSADADLIVERIAEAIGVAEVVPEHRGTTWAVHRLFEEVTRQRPLVVVFDDIQWAEPVFLDLVESVAEQGEVPLLVLCMARPELLELRMPWGTEPARIVLLEPLSDEESGRLVDNLLAGAELDGAALATIVEAADGLPLFVEELVAMLIEDGSLRRDDGRWVADDLARVGVPAGIHALLAARLDRLEAPQRAVLQRGSVEGQVFHRGAVEALSPESVRAGVEVLLSELVLRALIEPAAEELSNGDAFRFHHLLLRDVAYDSLDKQERARLHARFADWLDEQAGERASEYDEIVGYHLEQAIRYETELRPGAARGRMAEQAAERLGRAGLRAHARGDWSATASLVTRSLELQTMDADGRSKLELALAEARLELAPARPGLFHRMRCVLRVPPGHLWSVAERSGSLALRCRRCGWEKRQRYTPHEAMPMPPGSHAPGPQP